MVPGPHKPPAGQALVRCDPGLMIMSIDGDKGRRVNNGRGNFDCAILLSPGEHRFGLDEHAAGGRGHFHAMAMAVEQLGAQPALERLDAPTDRGLFGVELGRCGAEAAGFCNGEEETYVVPVAENIGDLALERRNRNHSNNRYNKVVGPKFT